MAYDFEKKELELRGKAVPIARFAVEFLTPFGCFDNIDAALERCKSVDMDPTLMIQPVVVIYDNADRSEIFFRGR